MSVSLLNLGFVKTAKTTNILTKNSLEYGRSLPSVVRRFKPTPSLRPLIPAKPSPKKTWVESSNIANKAKDLYKLYKNRHITIPIGKGDKGSVSIGDMGKWLGGDPNNPYKGINLTWKI
tara:strand:- start:932 stop:1288 length:357 start_codon:yes stop_codon:yes gene_type:complete